MCDCPWTPASVAKLLTEAKKYGKPVDLWMSARGFADLRKFARDVLDINTYAPTWKNGFMGTIYGTKIHISGARPGWLSVRDSDGEVLVHALKGGNRGSSTVEHAHHQGHPYSCSDPDCIVRFVMTG